MTEPVTIAEARWQLKEPADTDAQIGALISAARGMVEDYTGLILTRCTVTEAVPTLGRWIDLRAWPVVSIDGISYLDRAGAAQTLVAGSWRASLAARPVRLLPVAAGWGVSGGYALDAVLPVTITMTAGYASPADVPEAVRQAIVQLIGHLYWHRGDDDAGKVDAIPPTVAWLLRPYRLRRV